MGWNRIAVPGYIYQDEGYPLPSRNSQSSVAIGETRKASWKRRVMGERREVQGKAVGSIQGRGWSLCKELCDFRDRLRHSHTMEYYTTLKRNELMLHTVSCMNLISTI